MNYRVYLLDDLAAIRAAESFSATEDGEAAHVAAVLFEACGDVFHGYELWRGSERIAPRPQPASASRGLEDVILSRQDIVLDLEDRLQRTFACVNQSRKLLERIDEIRTLRPV
jgi:hypothetical protein